MGQRLVPHRLVEVFHTVWALPRLDFLVSTVKKLKFKGNATGFS